MPAKGLRQRLGLVPPTHPAENPPCRKRASLRDEPALDEFVHNLWKRGRISAREVANAACAESRSNKDPSEHIKRLARITPTHAHRDLVHDLGRTARFLLYLKQSW